MDSSADQFKKTIEDPLSHLRFSTILSFARGQTIYSPGEPATNVFLIISGKVKTTRAINGGQNIVTGIYQPDDVFGESAFTESYRPDSTSALENTMLMTWTAAQIQDTGLESPRLLYALLQVMSKRLLGDHSIPPGGAAHPA